ncbi:hypothetical protein [Paraburkholderia sediminicola]|uniref:hypothetical protein n=1 Tax=Paraburkholderia sediminicola TaxID=458836 RepID=UPI0038B8F842
MLVDNPQYAVINFFVHGKFIRGLFGGTIFRFGAFIMRNGEKMKIFNVDRLRLITVFVALAACKSMIADAQTASSAQMVAPFGSTQLANSFSSVPQTAQEKARSNALQLIANPAAYMQMVLSEVCFGSESQYPLIATISRYFSPNYQQYTNDELLNYNDFVTHIAALRASVTSGKVTVLDAVFQGDTIADRHIVSVILPDGTTSQSEVYLFGKFSPDGRLKIVHEATRSITGDTSAGKL